MVLLAPKAGAQSEETFSYFCTAQDRDNQVFYLSKVFDAPRQPSELFYAGQFRDHVAGAYGFEATDPGQFGCNSNELAGTREAIRADHAMWSSYDAYRIVSVDWRPREAAEAQPPQTVIVEESAPTEEPAPASETPPVEAQEDSPAADAPAPPPEVEAPPAPPVDRQEGAAAELNSRITAANAEVERRNAEARAQYEAARAAFEAERRAYEAEAARVQAARQQYESDKAAWEAKVAACKAGDVAACAS